MHKAVVPALAGELEHEDEQYHVVAHVGVVPEQQAELHEQQEVQLVLEVVVAAVVRQHQVWHLAYFHSPINHLPVVREPSTD
jgi:hypothetical protein